ncbi:hypothetical protein C8R43DRAFT_868219 [Mycena crocata]|nr:hypothetical protein C8R43DRAFT_868219 [Mycena crocata]
MLTYLFGLTPGLLYGILPDVFWRSWCKIVRGFQLIYQKKIKREEVVEAHRMLCDAVEEFEKLYYQRLPSRLHFVRQSIHQLLHLAFEIIRLGPGAYYTQWTMEHTIGNLGQELKQHVTPYANLSQRACRRAQVNSLKSMIPDLEPTDDVLPRGSIDLKSGFVLLGGKDEYAQQIPGPAGEAIKRYLEEAFDSTYAENLSPNLQRWARLRLPNGQITRSAWKEQGKALKNVRMARNVQFNDPDIGPSYGEVQFYFQADINGRMKTLALAAPYTRPDHDLLTALSNTLWVCRTTGQTLLQVVDVKTMMSVVGMVPFQNDGRVFVVHKMGLDV